MKINELILILYISFLTQKVFSFYHEQGKAHHDHINTHSRYLHKLIIPISILSTIKFHKSTLKEIISQIIKTSICFNNPLIKDCIQEMHRSQSLCPLFKIWVSLNEYHFLNNEEFKKEFCILILLLYKGVCIHLNVKEKKIILTYINTYYETINKKELNELLDILNIIAQELKPLLESIIINKTKTWREWIIKFGGALAITCLTIVIKIILYEKNKTYNEGSANTEIN